AGEWSSRPLTGRHATRLLTDGPGDGGRHVELRRLEPDVVGDENVTGSHEDGSSAGVEQRWPGIWLTLPRCQALDQGLVASAPDVGEAAALVVTGGGARGKTRDPVPVRADVADTQRPVT